MEHRIYVNNKLVNMCYNEYALMCNVVTYRKKFGDENVTVKHCKEMVNDKEKEDWLKTL